MRLDSGQIEVLDDAMAGVLRKKTPAERIAIGFALWTSAKQILAAHLKSTHPDWDEKHIQSEIAKRLSHGALGRLGLTKIWDAIQKRLREPS